MVGDDSACYFGHRSSNECEDTRGVLGYGRKEEGGFFVGDS